MSLIPYTSAGAIARLAVTPSQLARAASLLRPVAQMLWNHREFLGEAAVSGKKLITSLISSPAKKSGKPRRAMARRAGNPQVDPSHSSPTLTSFSSSSVLSNAGFIRIHQTASGDGCRVLGTVVLGDCVRFGGTGGANSFVITTTTQNQNSATGGVSNIVRLIHPSVMIPASDSSVQLTRMQSMVQLYSQFRFLHLHVRFIPSLNITNSNQQSMSVGYMTDPLAPTMELNVNTGPIDNENLTSTLLQQCQLSTLFPAWAPADLELNWSDPAWYYTDAAGGGYADLNKATSTTDDAEIRQAYQGALVFGCTSKVASPAVVFGTWVADYVIDFQSISAFPDFEAFTAVQGLPKPQQRALAALIQDGWLPTSGTETPSPPSSSTVSGTQKRR